jgi:hypothetical protein
MCVALLRVCLIWVVGCAGLYAQSNASSKPPASIASLSKPLDMGIFDARMFEDDSRKVRFKLETSWIPGEKHKGMMRYKLNMVVLKPASLDELATNGATNVPDANAGEFIKRIYRCKVSLDIFDEDDFTLRKHDVPFLVSIDDQQAHPNGLTANDSLQLDASEYREFSTTGSWSISWRCTP